MTKQQAKRTAFPLPPLEKECDCVEQGWTPEFSRSLGHDVATCLVCEGREPSEVDDGN